jgi:hypothetical protein
VAVGWPLEIHHWWKWIVAAADWAVIALLLAAVLIRGYWRLRARART